MNSRKTKNSFNPDAVPFEHHMLTHINPHPTQYGPQIYSPHHFEADVRSGVEASMLGTNASMASRFLHNFQQNMPWLVEVDIETSSNFSNDLSKSESQPKYDDSDIWVPASQPVSSHETTQDLILYRRPSIGHMAYALNETLVFFCGTQEGIRLDLALEGDMQSLFDPDYRGFFEGFGDKASYRIYMPDGRRFTRQKYCKQMLNKRPVYITRKKIVYEVAKFILDFLANHPYAADRRAIFADQQVDRVELEHFVLVELKRVSKASVQPIFRYRPSVLAWPI